MLIVDLNVALEGIGQVLGRVETGGSQDVSDAAVEVFDHAIGLGRSGLDQAMFDAVGGANEIERVGTSPRMETNPCRSVVRDSQD